MKKRMLSALLALCMMLTMVPTVAFAAEPQADGAKSGSIVMAVGEERTIQGTTEGNTGDDKWNVYPEGGYDEKGLQIVTTDNDGKSVTVKALKNGAYRVQHLYGTENWWQVGTESFLVTVASDKVTLNDVSVYTEIESLPYNENGEQDSTTLDFTLTYHGTAAPGNPEHSSDFAAVQFTATVSGTGRTLLVPAEKVDSATEMPAGYYRMNYTGDDPAWNSTAIQQDDQTVYLQVIKDGTAENNTIKVVSSDGSEITSGYVDYSTITMIPNTYSLTYVNNDGEAPEAVSGLLYNQPVEMPNIEREGYTLTWTDGTFTYNVGDSVIIKGDTTLTAKWVEGTVPDPDPEEPPVSGTMLYVNASADEEGADGTEAHPYPNIQAAVDAITEAQAEAVASGTAKYDWENYTAYTINVAEGNYGRFLVPHETANITIVGSGDGTVISTLDGSPLNVDEADKHGSDGQGIIIWGANITLKDMKITSGTETNDVWYASAVGSQDGMWGSSNENGTPIVLVNVAFQGAGAGYAVMPQRNAFTMDNCRVDNYEQAVYFAGDTQTANDWHITNNTIIDCVYAIHGYFGADEAQNYMEISGNTISGNGDRFSVIAILDQSNTGAVKLDIHDNDFSYTIVGGINQRETGSVAQGSMEDVLAANTFADNSFVADAYWYTAEDYGTAFYAPKQAGKIATWYGDPTSEAASDLQKEIIKALEDYGTAGQVIEINAPAQEIFTLAKNALVINEYVDAGDLQITKTVSNNESDTTEFAFQIKFTRSATDSRPLNGRYEYIAADGSTQTATLANGAMTVHMKSGERVTIKDLLPGTQYTVTELAVADYTQTASENATGAIVAKETQTAAFTNEYTPASIPEPEKPDIDKTATDLDSNDRTDVTLTVGADQETVESNVVFVLDKSTSADVRASAGSMLDELLTRVDEGNTVNVAVVSFEKGADTVCDWTELTTNNVGSIKEAIQNKRDESGTNIYLGLMTGKELLDEKAGGDNHLVLVTDGITYLWSDAEGNGPYTIYSESISNGEESLNAGNDMMGAHHADTASYFKEFENIATWYDQHGADIQNDISTYQHEYGVGQYQPDMKGQQADSTYNTAGFSQDQNDYIPGESAREHYSANDAAVYMTVNAWKDILSAGYHAYAFADVTEPNAANAVTFPWASKFIGSLNTAGGTSAIIDDTDVSGMFDSVKNSILYTIQKGVVNVVIGEDFDMTYEISKDTFALTVGGEPVEASEVDGNTVYFGTKDENGTYPYVVTYYPEGKNGDTREQFDWYINVPVQNSAALQLTYSLTLVNKESASGTYTVPTNEKATLDYETTTGGSGTLEFPVPDVKYTVGAIKITPVDVTLYIGGTSSYWEDIDGEQIPSVNSGIPAPHFYISGASDEQIANMTFHGTGKNEAGETVDKVWKVEPYGGEDAQAVGENGQKVWNIVSADENAADASCLYFSDMECTDSVEVDNIDGNQYTHLYATISTSNASGAGNTNLYAMVGGQRYELDYGVGDLTIRSVTNDATSGQEYIFGVAHSTESDIYAVQNDTVAAADATQNGTEAGVVAPYGTNYTVNGKTNWTLVGENTSLLFDDVLSTYELGESGEHDASEAGETMLEQAVIDNAEELGLTDMSGRQYESKYFDLVDAADGNVWVKADNQIVVYWPYPEGITSSNADEYDFDLFHFTGMHREYERGQDEAQELVNQAAANINNHGDYDISNDTVALMVEDIELTDHGIQFIVDQDAFGFSPFVLTWVAKDDSDGGNHSSGGGDNKPDDLNTEDHFAYIIGYPKDYRTGEPTDDESLWPVEPQGNITRAEVATIFFRMLTDDARNENWSQTNSFTDVASTEWYNNAISTLANMGIISGDPDGSFRPDDSITRAEFTKIAVGFFDKAGDYVDGTYEDVSASDWYADFIDAAVDLGLIEGYPDGTIRPNASITRAEACTIVNRTLGRVPDKDHLLAEDEMRVWPDNSDTDAWYYAQIQEATNSHDYNWITEDGEEIEEWTDKLADRDWAQLEREWSDANSAPGGEVVD